MINSTRITITFKYKGKEEVRNIDKMHVSYYEIKDFYRIKGKEINFDIYKKDGAWFNKLEPGLKQYLLPILGAAIEEAETNGTYAPGKNGLF